MWLRQRYYSILEGSYIKDTPPARLDWRFKQAEELLTLSGWEVTETGSGDLSVKRRELQGSKEGKNNARNGPVGRPVQNILEDLLFALHAEVWESTFNYLEFHWLCRTLFLLMDKKCESLIPVSREEAGLEGPGVMLLPGRLMLIRNEGHQGELADYKKRMKTAGEVMDKFLKSGIGSVVCSKLRGLSIQDNGHQGDASTGVLSGNPLPCGQLGGKAG